MLWRRKWPPDSAISTADNWYYVDGTKSIGPVTFVQLRKVLSKSPNPGEVLVWRDGFSDWRLASGVPEFSHLGNRPPSLSRLRPQLALSADKSRYSDGNKKTSGRPSLAKELASALLGGSILVGIIVFIVSSQQAGIDEEKAEQDYINAHPLTEKQKAANEHFGKCWEYRRIPASVWSETQRNTMLIGEACYSDDRDDPRALEATYPYNPYVPKPWQQPK